MRADLAGDEADFQTALGTLIGYFQQNYTPEDLQVITLREPERTRGEDGEEAVLPSTRQQDGTSSYYTEDRPGDGGEDSFNEMGQQGQAKSKEKPGKRGSRGPYNTKKRKAALELERQRMAERDPNGYHAEDSEEERRTAAEAAEQLGALSASTNITPTLAHHMYASSALEYAKKSGGQDLDADADMVASQLEHDLQESSSRMEAEPSDDAGTYHVAGV